MKCEMLWSTPEIVEIAMNAEIGGYQADFNDPEPVGPHGPVVEGPSRTAAHDAP